MTICTICWRQCVANFAWVSFTITAYGPQAFSDFLIDPANQGNVVEFDTETECLSQVYAASIDGCVADHIVGATLSWRNQWSDQLAPLPTKINEGILYILFSKASVSSATIAKLNSSMGEIRDSGRWSEIAINYLDPILIAMTTESKWYKAIDYLGTVAFAISGLLLAYRERFSVFGAIVLAALPAAGGGIVRDLIVGRMPVAFVRSPEYALIILGVVVFGYLVINTYERFRAVSSDDNRVHLFGERTVEVFDAMGLASFTVTGVAVAVASNIHPLWLWGPVLAVLTAAGGGMIRDVVRGKLEQSALKSALYAEIALFWGCAISIFLTVMGEGVTPIIIFSAILITMVAAFVTRIVVYLMGWTAPLYQRL